MSRAALPPPADPVTRFATELLFRLCRNAALLFCAAASLAAARPAAAQTTTFRGAVLYEKVPVEATGLRLDALVRKPAAGVRVEVVASPSRRVLGSGFTDAKGAYAIPVTLSGRQAVFVRALAQTENATVVRVGDRMEFAMVAPAAPVRPGRAVTTDLLATDSSRVAGAFNIATTIARANALVQSAQPGVALPKVEIRWDTAYVGGTFFRESERTVFVNGKRGEDSDEYDDHVIAHEYGHFLMAAFSRDPSPGGDHGFGERLDPRLAWSEGWGNFFGAAATGASRYIDTGVIRGRQGVLLEMDLEVDAPKDDVAGIWSEHSVGSALWDWFDAAGEEGDSVALGFAPLWTAFTGLARVPDAYLLRFADVLGAQTRQGRLLAATLRTRGIPYAVGQEPRPREPFPEPLPAGTAVTGTVDSRSTRRSNLYRSSAHYGFTLSQARQVTITLKILDARDEDHADLDLYLFDQAGEEVGESNAVNGVGDTERIQQLLQPGYYRVEVRSWSGGGSPLRSGSAHQGTFSLVARY
jgi:hypothetical protein